MAVRTGALYMAGRGFPHANSCCKCCLLSYLSPSYQCGQQKQTSPANHKQPVSYINYTGQRPHQWNTVTASMLTQRRHYSVSTVYLDAQISQTEIKIHVC